MSERSLKTGWHLLLAALAVIETTTTKNDFRRCVLGACAGWHVAAAINDWFDQDQEEIT